MRKIIKILVVMLLVGILLTSTFFVCKELKQNKEQDEVIEEIVQIAENKKKIKNNKQDIDLSKLYKINKDIVGWIKIKNTNINYPVMQSEIKDYYLRRDFYKNYSSYGTPFIPSGGDVQKSDNIIIYGHHMRNRRMFGSLEDYKSKRFYEEKRIVYFYTLRGNKTIKKKYEIFAIFKTSVYISNEFKYYNYINFYNKSEFEEFIKMCKEKAIYETNIIPEYKDKLITLSTCEYSQKNGRLVIVAKEV